MSSNTGTQNDKQEKILSQIYQMIKSDKLTRLTNRKSDQSTWIEPDAKQIQLKSRY